eukprot:ctg_1780.g386
MRDRALENRRSHRRRFSQCDALLASAVFSQRPAASPSTPCLIDDATPSVRAEAARGRFDFGVPSEAAVLPRGVAVASGYDGHNGTAAETSATTVVAGIVADDAYQTSARLPGPGRIGAGGAAVAQVGAVGVHRRGRKAEEPARQGKSRGGVRRGKHPRHVPAPNSDEHHVDVRARAAGGEDRAHGRSIRETALVAGGARKEQGVGVTHLPWGYDQRAGVYRRGTRAGPASHADGVSPEHRHHQSGAVAGAWRVCGPAPHPRYQFGVCERYAAGETLPGVCHPHHRRAEIHVQLWSAGRLADGAAGGVFRVARGAAAAIRGGAGAPLRNHRQALRHLGAHAVVWRSHPSAGRRARGVSARHRQSDRHQVRPDAERCRAAAAAGHAQPEQRARTHHPDHPRRRGQSARTPAAPYRGCAALRPRRHLVVRPDARQHLFPGAPGDGHFPGRHPPGNDRSERDRMRGRHEQAVSRRPENLLRVAVRPAAEREPESGAGVSVVGVYVGQVRDINVSRR